MDLDLNKTQSKQRLAFQEFARLEALPFAEQADREERLPEQLMINIAQRGYLGALLPRTYSGLGLDWIAYGLLQEALGATCPSAAALVNVQNMVSQSILKWGSPDLRTRWLPALAQGEAIAAFALSEPEVGSDAGHIQLSCREDGDAYALEGSKTWISFAQVASLFLVFAQSQGRPCAFVVERKTPGLSIQPIGGLLGLRATMMAELTFSGCQIPKDHLLGSPGFGFAPVAVAALGLGRYSVAWMAVGIAQACLDASLEFAAKRRQFGVEIREHQLIRQMITEMLVNLKAARLLCYQAGCLHQQGAPSAFSESMVAKYYAAQAAVRAANDALQIHAARGATGDSPLQRYLRDAKLLEIIEGTQQILQDAIAGFAYQEAG